MVPAASTFVVNLAPPKRREEAPEAGEAEGRRAGNVAPRDERAGGGGPQGTRAGKRKAPLSPDVRQRVVDYLVAQGGSAPLSTPTTAEEGFRGIGKTHLQEFCSFEPIPASNQIMAVLLPDSPQAPGATADQPRAPRRSRHQAPWKSTGGKGRGRRSPSSE